MIEATGLVEAVEQASDGIVITDANGRIQYVNPAFSVMTGYSSEEAIGQFPSILKSGQHTAAFYSELWDTVRSGRTWHGDMVNRRKNGSLYHEEMRIAPVRNANGEILSYIATKHDVTERRAAEQVQALLAAIVENCDDGIIAYSPAGTIVTWNRGAEKIFGYSDGEVLGQHWSMLLPPERKWRVAQAEEEVSKGRNLNQQEGLALRKDGRRIHIAVTTCPIKDATGELTAVSLIVRDISERKEAEKTRSLLASIVESSLEAIIGTDDSGRVISWNRGSEELFGYTKDEAIGQDVAAFSPPDRCDEVRRVYGAVLSGTSVDPFETTGQRKDGSRFDALVATSPIRNSAGEVTGVSVICRDISVRVRAQQMLRESEERFRAVFEHAPIGIGVRALDGRLLQANEAICRMLGYSELELIGTTWADLLHPNDQEHSRWMMEKLQSEPGLCLEAEKRLFHRSGRLVWASIRVSLVRDSRNEPAYFVVHVDDITERKQAIEALRESEERFRIMADSCPAMMWVTNAEGTPQFVNRAFLEFCGASGECVDAATWKSMLHPEDEGRFTECFQLAVRGRTTFNQEARVRGADGEWRVIASYAAPRFSPAGEFLGHVGINADITDRKHAEDALRESEQSYQRQFADNSAVMLLVDPTNGRVVDANSAALRFYGYSREQLLAMRITDINTLPEAEVQRYMVSVTAGSGKLFDFQHRLADGSVRDVQASLSRIRFGRRTVLHSIIFDVTARKRAEEALRESEERFRILADSCPAVMWVTDASGGNQFVNQAHREFCGAPDPQLDGDGWQSLFHPEDVPAYVGAFQHAIRGQLPFSGEARLRRVDGEWRWVETHAKPRFSHSGEFQGHAGVCLDITERKQSEDAMRESEERFRVMADGCPAVMWVTDAEGGIQFINKAYRDFTGTACEAVEGQKWQLVLHPEDAPSYIEAYQCAVRKRASFQAETRIRRADGEWRWVDSHAEPRFSPHGEFLGHVGLSPDVTERKLAEQSLDRQNAIMNSLLESLPMGVFMVEAPSGKPIFANAAAQGMLGRGIIPDATSQDLAGVYQAYKGPDKCPYPPEELPIVLGLNGQSTHIDDMVVVRPDGTETMLEIFGSPVRNKHGKVWASLVCFADITRRKLVDDALRASETRLRGITDSARDAIIMMDPSGAVTFWNPAAESILGYREDEAIGNELHQLLVPESCREAQRMAFPEFGRCGRGPAVGKTIEQVARRKDGREIAVDLSLASICLNGEWHAIGIMRDTTERKQAMEALLSSEEKFRQLAENVH